MTKQLVIDGKLHPGARVLEVDEPALGRPFESVSVAGVDDLNAAVASAAAAFPAWSSLGPWRRAEHLNAFAARVESAQDELATLESRNVGKPIGMARWEAGHVAETLRFYANAALTLRGHQIPVAQGGLDLATREPIGVCGLIAPWNFPMVIATWKLAPALASGNTVVLKPASITPLTALRLAELALESGLPPGVFNVVVGPGREIGEALVRHSDVRKVSFTGETATGRRVLEIASANITRVTLELGGKSPNVIFDDVDPTVVAKAAAGAGFSNTGQDCCARSRVLVQRGIYEEFCDALVTATANLVIGDPLDPQTDLGPLASRTQLERSLEYVAIGESEGARLLAGGKRIDSDGWFMTPAIFADATPGMRIMRVEIFGPVLQVCPFDTEQDAIAIANGTEYGLSGSVWSADIGRGLRVARAVRSGVLAVNGSWTTHLGAPFGGLGKSGMGRELGLEAFDHYTEWRNIWIDTDAQVARSALVRSAR